MVKGPVLQCRDVGVQVDGRWLVQEASCAFSAGSLVALVGPNGAGKSTLLGVLSGDRVPSTGSVLVAGRPLREHRSKDLARERSVMRQQQQPVFAFSVAEVVAMGRVPYPADTDLDAEIVEECLRTTEMQGFRDRDVTTLSGGETARTGFARVLGQTTPIVLLDEPTAALDLRHQEDVLAAAAHLRDVGCCVVVVLHDLNLAARYADRLVVIANGRLVADGDPTTVLTAQLLAEVYQQDVHVLQQPGSGLPLVVPVRASTATRVGRRTTQQIHFSGGVP